MSGLAKIQIKSKLHSHKNE